MLSQAPARGHAQVQAQVLAQAQARAQEEAQWQAQWQAHTQALRQAQAQLQAMHAYSHAQVHAQAQAAAEQAQALAVAQQAQAEARQLREQAEARRQQMVAGQHATAQLQLQLQTMQHMFAAQQEQQAQQALALQQMQQQMQAFGRRPSNGLGSNGHGHAAQGMPSAAAVAAGGGGPVLSGGGSSPDMHAACVNARSIIMKHEAEDHWYKNMYTTYGGGYAAGRSINCELAHAYNALNVRLLTANASLFIGAASNLTYAVDGDKSAPKILYLIVGIFPDYYGGKTAGLKPGYGDETRLSKIPNEYLAPDLTRQSARVLHEHFLYAYLAEQITIRLLEQPNAYVEKHSYLKPSSGVEATEVFKFKHGVDHATAIAFVRDLMKVVMQKIHDCRAYPEPK